MRSCEAAGAVDRESALESAEWSLGDYLDDWLERRRSQLRPTTHHSYRQLIRCYLRPMLGEQQLQAVDRRMLERAYAGLLARGGVVVDPWRPRPCSIATACCVAPWKMPCSTG
jgi:hypothetical protein